MKKTWLIMVVGLLFLFTLVGCNNSSSSGGQSSGKSSSNERQDINIGTGTTTGVYYPLGAAFAKVWQNALDGVKVSSQATDGSVQNINLMQQGKINVGFTTIDVLYDAYHGKGQFKSHPYKDFRILAALYPNVGQMLTTKGSGIKSIEDFKGKKFVPGAPGSSTRILAEQIFEAYGLTLKDVNAQYVGFTEATNLMRNHQVDGTIVMAGVPTSAVVEILSSADGQLVGIDEEHIKKLEKNPLYKKYVIPAGTYDGQDQDVTTISQINLLIVPKQLPDDEVYDLTKSLWENIEEIGNSITAAKGAKLEQAASNLAGLPLHPGAKKYYQEKGVLKE